MGLSGRKVKQRIGKDPRNLSWADDASRFGQSYLEKFGWDASKGLGASGEGRTTAIKATQKLDMLGIGMQHQKDPNGIAWRQQRDFENLLHRLNGGTNAPGPFCKARAESESLEGGEEKSVGDTQKLGEDEGRNEEGEGVIEKKDKKKKRRKNAEESEEDIHDKKRRKKRKKSKEDGDGDNMSNTKSEQVPPPPPAQEPGSAPMAAVTVPAPTPVSVRAPPRTHRARMIAAKRMASSNSTALAEILGIPSSSTSSLPSPYPSTAATPTPVPDPMAAEAQEPLQQLMTSSQSVGDYFKAKLSAKRESSMAIATADPPASVPTPDDNDDYNRAGLGSGGGASRAMLMNSLDEERARGGIGASSSKFATMFTLGRPTTDTREENVAEAAELDDTRDATDYSDDRRKSEKKRTKEERRRKKEEKRRRRAEAGQPDVDGAVDMPTGEAPAGQAKKKKRDEHGVPGGSSQDTQPSSAGRTEDIRPKKRKKGDKDNKSAKHRRPEE